MLRQITVCNRCHGQGKVVKKSCRECKGKGVIEKTKEIKVTIPPGADTGYQIKVEGEGERSEGLPGDLYVVLHVEKHPVFERHGDDIYLQQDIDFTTAALGGTIKVAGLDGNLSFDVPAETQTGTTFRIDGEGIPRLNGYSKGDQYVMVKIVTPQNLTKKEKELLKELDRLQKEKNKTNDE
jgi:molecular chaperone DnaJ